MSIAIAIAFDLLRLLNSTSAPAIVLVTLRVAETRRPEATRSAGSNS
jgi:hypothetical protein